MAEVLPGDGEDMLKAWVKDRRQYVDCALGKKALIEAIKPLN